MRTWGCAEPQGGPLGGRMFVKETGHESIYHSVRRSGRSQGQHRHRTGRGVARCRSAPSGDGGRGQRSGDQGAAATGQRRPSAAHRLRSRPLRLRAATPPERAGLALRRGCALVDPATFGRAGQDRQARRHEARPPGPRRRVGGGARARQCRRSHARSGSGPRGCCARAAQCTPPTEGAAAAQRHRLQRPSRVERLRTCAGWLA